MLVYRNVRKALGLDRCRFCFTGAAPVMKDTLDYFLSLDIPMLDLYGMSESSGPHTISLPDRFLTGSVGIEFPGASTKLDGKDKDGNGEVSDRAESSPTRYQCNDISDKPRFPCQSCVSV